MLCSREIIIKREDEARVEWGQKEIQIQKDKDCMRIVAELKQKKIWENFFLLPHLSVVFSMLLYRSSSGFFSIWETLKVHGSPRYKKYNSKAIGLKRA